MIAPVIGITSYLEPASWGVWRDVPATLLPHSYAASVARAGGVALLIPPVPFGGADWAGAVLDRVDGLILAGGVDVEPSRYGRQPHASVQQSRPDRDASELALAEEAVARDLPLLGICRGMQVMAVATGGTLVQHLPDEVGHTRHSPGPGRYGTHEVRIAAGSRLHAVLGDAVAVPTYHHQSVATHPGYVATAWEAEDGVLEAMENPSARFRLAVQWHPEEAEDARLFQALVEVCAG